MWSSLIIFFSTFLYRLVKDSSGAPSLALTGFGRIIKQLVGRLVSLAFAKYCTNTGMLPYARALKAASRLNVSIRLTLVMCTCCCEISRFHWRTGIIQSATAEI